MNTPDRAGAVGRGDDAAHSGDAVDDVFGADAAYDEVYEWVGDDEADGAVSGIGGRPPSASMRERAAALRAALSGPGPVLRKRASTLRAALKTTEGRRIRRRALSVAVAVLVTSAASIGFTAWFDAVAGAADKADVVALAVDSIVNGDPAASTYDSSARTAVTQYVVELANNGPDPVAVTSVAADAGARLSATGWQPLGPSAVIQPGGTGKVLLTVRVDCVWQLTAGLLTQNGGVGELAFPDLSVMVRTQSGDLRNVTLPTRTDIAPDTQSDDNALKYPGSDQSNPRIVTADDGACRQALGKTNPFGIPSRRSADLPIQVSYAGVATSATATDKTFSMRFTVRNVSTGTATLKAPDTRFDANDAVAKADWLPKTVSLDPGATATITVTVHVQLCIDPELLDVGGMVQMHVDGTGSAGNAVNRDLFLPDVLTGGIKLAQDETAQFKAACS